MLVKIALTLDFLLLAIVIYFFFQYTSRERRQFKENLKNARELQQKIYQVQVLKEIGQRIGYELNSNKVVEIITSSVGNILDYDTVSSMVLSPENTVTWRCHIRRQVSPSFVAEIKQQALQEITSYLDGQKIESMDEAMTGGILDDTTEELAQSVIHVPLMDGARLAAVISVASRKAKLYTRVEQDSLSALAKQAGTALAHLRNLLDSERAKLKAIIDAMTDGVLVVTDTNQLIMWNQTARALLGLPEGVEISMFDVITALGGKLDIRTNIEQALAKNQPVRNLGITMDSKIVDIVTMPLRAVEAERGGAVVVLRDVTSEKDLEKVKQDFTAMMVHELRAPLTAIRWSVGNLIQKSDGVKQVPAQQVHDTAWTIGAATKNMLDLVNDLLDVAKMEAGKFELNVQSVDVVKLMQEQITMFKPLSDSKHLDFKVTMPDKLVIEGDSTRLSQVFSNLISNAVKYTDNGAVAVDCHLEQNGSKVKISVTDSGIGIPQDLLPLLFSKFRQLGTSDRVERRQGTGLGLVVSRGIVESHGGTIWAESPGESLGTSFFLVLPVKHK